jgi:transposase
MKYDGVWDVWGNIFHLTHGESLKSIQTHEMLKSVYGDAAVVMKTVYKWFERFRNDCELYEDEERSGGP